MKYSVSLLLYGYGYRIITVSYWAAHYEAWKTREFTLLEEIDMLGKHIEQFKALNVNRL